MADTKISALPAASTLAGTEVLPVVQGGATKAATAGQIAALVDLSGKADASTVTALSDEVGTKADADAVTTALAGKADASDVTALDGRVTTLEDAGSGTDTKTVAQNTQGRPLKIAFAGDSIAELFGQLKTASPFFHAFVKKPRALLFHNADNTAGVVAVSGSKSGTLKGAGGATVYTAVDGTDFNTPAMLAHFTDRPADILVVIDGTNDSSFSPDDTSTFTNVREAIEAADSRHTILFPILPRNGWTTADFSRSYNSYVRAYAAATPGVHVLGVEHLFADSALGVKGGAGGTAGDPTVDGLHPSLTYGKAMEPMLSALLDTLGVPAVQPRAITGGDVYSSTRPGLNILGVAGAMSGTFAGDFVTAPCAGVVPEYSWQLGAADNNDEMIATASKSSFDFEGNTVDSIKLVISGSGAMTANRRVHMNMSTTLPAGDQVDGVAQALVRISNPTGLLCVSLTVAGYIGGSYKTVQMGGNFSFTAADLLPSDLDEVWQYMMPGPLPFDPETSITFSFDIWGLSGETAGGTIEVAQVGYHQLALPAAA